MESGQRVTQQEQGPVPAGMEHRTPIRKPLVNTRIPQVGFKLPEIRSMATREPFKVSVTGWSGHSGAAEGAVSRTHQAGPLSKATELWALATMWVQKTVCPVKVKY